MLPLLVRVAPEELGHVGEVDSVLLWRCLLYYIFYIIHYIILYIIHYLHRKKLNPVGEFSDQILHQKIINISIFVWYFFH